MGRDLKSCIAHAKEQMSYEVIYDELIKNFMARPIRVHGAVLFDEFGLMMIGSIVKNIDLKIKTEALSLLDELGINTDKEVWDHDQS